MYQDKTILELLTKAKQNGYKFTLVVDEIDLTEWEIVNLPAGGIELFQMSDDRKTTARRIYKSLFDPKLANAIWGADYKDTLLKMVDALIENYELQNKAVV